MGLAILVTLAGALFTRFRYRKPLWIAGLALTVVGTIVPFVL
jgi:hypothetical protein